MYIIGIKVDNNLVGYFCGFRYHKGEKLAGYEENIEHKAIKDYQKKNNADKAVRSLVEFYKGNDNYTFEVIEI